MISAENLCELINSSLQNLEWNFAEEGNRQKLSLNSYPPVYFSTEAGGVVAGGSAKWMRKKHNHGMIHEPGMLAVLDVLKKTARDIEVFFDVGSLYGYFSLVGASIFHPVHVVAFEMNRYSYGAMEENLSMNPNFAGDGISTFNCAVSSASNKNKSVLFNCFAVRDLQNCSWLEKIRYFFSKNKGFEKNTIDYWSIDDFCSVHKMIPDLIKIDVEGHQAEIIPGCMGVIKKFRPLMLIEFDDPTAVNATKKTNKETIKPLMDVGYQLILGDHRTVNSTFYPLSYDELTDEHETNSLALLYPVERFT